MELLIALIPALPLAGFLFAVLVGPRLDHVPLHGHGEAHGDHEKHHEPHGDALHDVDDSPFRTCSNVE